MCVLELSWYLVVVRSRGEAALTAALTAEGHHHYRPVRAPRPSPLPNRPNLKGELFPGHLFVEFPFHADLYARIMALPGVANVICNDRGRPFHIPDDYLSALAEYCALGPGETASGAFHMLDVLGPRDRVEQVLSMLQTRGGWSENAADSRVPLRVLRRAVADKAAL